MYLHHNKHGADLIVEAPKHDPLIKWPTWGHVTVWKIYISIFTRFITNKLRILLTLGGIFSMQTLKSSPTCCYVFILAAVQYLYESLMSKLGIEKIFYYSFSFFETEILYNIYCKDVSGVPLLIHEMHCPSSFFPFFLSLLS